MQNNSQLEIVITAKDEASAKVQGLTNRVKAMQPAFKTMAAAGGIAFATFAAVAVDAFNAYSDAAAQTEITTNSLMNTVETLSDSAFKKLSKSIDETESTIDGLIRISDEAGKAAVKLGFDDETAARSFAKLFAVTKDVTSAQKEVSLAMDLARFKNISLEDATQKLIMVHSGATKELKSLGIAVTDGATAMQNLDAIQKQVAFSAQGYATTTKGQIEVIKVNIDNLKESIGAALAPAVTKLLEQITPLIEKFVAWAEQHPDLIAKILLIGGGVSALVLAVGTLGLLLPGIITAFTVLGPVILPISAIILGLIVIVKNVIAIFNLFKNDSKAIWEGIKAYFKEAIDAVVGYFKPLIDIIEMVMSKLSALASGVKNVVGGAISTVTGLVSGRRAQGGNVSGGSTYLVGENGPELFTSSTSGLIVPNNRLAGAGGIVVNINGGTYLSADVAHEIGDMIIERFKRVARI